MREVEETTMGEDEMSIEEYGDHNSMVREDNDDRAEFLEMMEKRSESQDQLDALEYEFAHYFNGEGMWDGSHLFEMLYKYKKAAEERILEIYDIQKPATDSRDAVFGA